MIALLEVGTNKLNLFIDKICGIQCYYSIAFYILNLFRKRVCHHLHGLILHLLMYHHTLKLRRCKILMSVIFITHLLNLESGKTKILRSDPDAHLLHSRLLIDVSNLKLYLFVACHTANKLKFQLPCAVVCLVREIENANEHRKRNHFSLLLCIASVVRGNAVHAMSNEITARCALRA